MTDEDWVQSQLDGQDGYLWATGSILLTKVNTLKCPQGSYWTVRIQTSCNTGMYNTKYASNSLSDCLLWKCAVHYVIWGSSSHEDYFSCICPFTFYIIVNKHAR